jgi:phenylalanyl-tRNA synthetase beta chain
MNASYEWLRAFVATESSPTEMRDLLTAHVATVEELQSLRTDLAPIIVARVVEAGRHPDSDHLWATKVDAGGPEPLEVICGAPNVTAGKLYPFAPVGTVMPNGMKIERRKIRGIASNGMLCSAKELGLGDNHEGILELDLRASPGTPLLAVMPIGDTRLVIDVGANRPDLLSHLGFARELSAITGHQWSLPEIEGLGPPVASAESTAREGSTAGVTVRVEPDTRTRRYMGAIIKGVRIGPSPEWLVQRLAAADVRSINNVVDATNYVLHELGQPVHAFDLGRLGPSVVVRRAGKSEKLVTLDGTARQLPQEAVVIANETSAQAVGGIMGGRDSEVTDATTDLFVEVASFDTKLTRTARKALGLSTDASYRFERGVDPHLGPVALDRVVRLVISLAGGVLADAPVDIVGALPASLEITLRMKRVQQVLGAAVGAAVVRRHLEGAGFEIVGGTATELVARVPTWRSDVFTEIDLVEEVARFQGYDTFPDEIRPYRPSTTYDHPLWGTANRVREALVARGLFEARPIPFVRGGDDTHVRVGNPISENEAFLRRSLLETLQARTEFNLSHRTGDVRLFEIGSAFAPGSGPMPREELRVAAVIMGRRRPTHFTEPQPPAFDEWDAKALGELAAAAAYPGRNARLVAGSEAVLWRIEVDGDLVGTVQQLPLDAPVWASPAFGLEMRLARMETDPPAPRGEHAYMEGGRPSGRKPIRYRPLPTMPPAEFDLALLVPRGSSVADVEQVIRQASGDLLESLILFDEYTGAGVAEHHRSLAWRLTFRHPERTLRDKEIEGRRAKILAALEQELHVRQRST